MLRRLGQFGHGHRLPDERDLALNLSFVLHERSDSRAVQSAVRVCNSHARTLHRFGLELVAPATRSGGDLTGVTTWLTAMVGLPHLLGPALNTSDESIHAIDADNLTTHTTTFFRAPAQLTLPDLDVLRVGVAVLVARPDRRSSQLLVSGVHDWPADCDAVLRSLERLIQAYAGQWLPPRRLWSAPAETLLANEVYQLDSCERGRVDASTISY